MIKFVFVSLRLRLLFAAVNGTLFPIRPVFFIFFVNLFFFSCSLIMLQEHSKKFFFQKICCATFGIKNKMMKITKKEIHLS